MNIHFGAEVGIGKALRTSMLCVQWAYSTHLFVETPQNAG